MNHTTIREEMQAPLTDEQESILQQLTQAGHDPAQAREWVLIEVAATPDEPARFAVTDMSSANWVLRKLAELQAKRDAVNAMCEAEIEAIENRRRRLLTPISNNHLFFGAAYGPQLEAWTREELKTQQGKRINLVHGYVGVRKNPDRLVVDDEDEAIRMVEWLQEHDPLTYPSELIRIKKEIARAELKTLMEQLGDDRLFSILPDDPKEEWTDKVVAHIEPGTDAFYCKAEKPTALGSEAA